MAKHIWIRVAGDCAYEVAETETLDPPEGEGWYLHSAFGVGRVDGAGGSPARSSKVKNDN